MSDTSFTVPELGDKFIDYRMPIWGNSYTWSWERPITQLEYLVIHHSVTSDDATPNDLALLHKARGWGGIGYHFVITNNGDVYYVGDVGTARANVLNKNEKVLGICMIGDFTKHLPTDEQIKSAHLLCKFMINTVAFPISSWDQVVGHKDLQATQCPGSSWDKTQQGDMWWRIKTGTGYTTPPTQQEDVYKITYKGETLSTYEKNPEDTIVDLQNKLTGAEGQVSTLTAEKSVLQGNLTTQEQNNADLLGQLTKVRIERDTARTKATTAQRKLDAAIIKIGTQEETIKLFKAQKPLEGFKWYELVGSGLAKLFTIKK